MLRNTIIFTLRLTYLQTVQLAWNIQNGCTHFSSETMSLRATPNSRSTSSKDRKSFITSRNQYRSKTRGIAQQIRTCVGFEVHFVNFDNSSSLTQRYRTQEAVGVKTENTASVIHMRSFFSAKLSSQQQRFNITTVTYLKLL